MSPDTADQCTGLMKGWVSVLGKICEGMEHEDGLIAVGDNDGSTGGDEDLEMDADPLYTQADIVETEEEV